MSSALTSTPSFPSSLQTCARTASMERRSAVLSSIKGRFARKGTEADLSSAKPPSNSTSPPPPSRSSPSHPLRNPPPTRRPIHSSMPQTITPAEPPPAYTPRQANSNAPSNNMPLQAAPAATNPTTADDSQYHFLSTFDTIFLIDDSGSMAGRSWRETSQALETITPICTQYDADGIDIHFLNAPSAPVHNNVTLASTVHEIFSTVRPSGGTPTGQRLNQLLKPYLRKLEQNPEGTKPINIIVITDGVPADDVESVVISAAKKLDRMDAEPWQVGIQFFQVGEEPGAAEHLAGLDDEMSRMGGGCRDIVDTVPFVRGTNNRGVGLTGENILKVVLGAVVKRLDRRTNTTQANASAPAATQ